MTGPITPPVADPPPPNLITAGIVSTLSDGTGVSQMTPTSAGLVGILQSKVVKDLVLDALLSVPVSLAAINIGGLQMATAAPVAVAFAVGDSLIRVLYRAALRWAQTPA